MPPADDNFERMIEDIGVGDSEGAVLPSEPHFADIPYRGIITASVMLATVMQTLDATIANVALPSMQGTLSASQDEMGWVLTSYIVASAVTIPLTGWLAGQFGRRRVFLISVAMFTISSALCGIATSLPEIVLFRFLQGMGGAALVPLSQAVLFDINSPKDFGRAMSVWAAGVTVGPILGPTIGGWLTQNYEWRWVFYMNVPIGILAFTGLFLTMPESRNEKSSRFDFFGFVVLSVAITAFQFMLDRGQLKGWFSSPEILTEAIVAAIGAYLFIVHMFSSREPFLNPALFKDRNFVASNVFIFMIGVSLFATLALLPPMLQTEMRYPVFLTGLIVAPRGIGSLCALIVAGRLMNRVDARLIMGCGMLLTTYALWLMSHFSLLMDPWSVIEAGLFQGIGTGLIYVPLSTVAFTTLPRHLRNEGTSLFNLVRNLGSSIGISVVMFLLTQNTQRVHSSLASNITPYGTPALGSGSFDLGSLKDLAALNMEVTRQSAMIAYLDDFRLMMILVFLAIPLLLLIRPITYKAESVVVLE